jgi:DeoR family glycerol-3-phosphate regulon repressor
VAVAQACPGEVFPFRRHDENRPPVNALALDATPLGDRQREILALARRRGRVLVDSLAEHFDVTPQTIRRDLNQLCDLRLLQRVHGGAVANVGTSNAGYAARLHLAAAGKEAIGHRAAQLIPNDASLMVNIGTTTEQVVRFLVRHVGLVVITNNLNIVEQLRPVENIELVMAGGTVRREDGGIVGDAAVEFIEQFKVDFAIIGVSAIEEDGALLDYDISEVRVARSIIANARKVILVADSLKFQRSAPVRIGDISQVDCLVTDAPPPEPFLERCALHGVRVEVAAAGPEGVAPPEPGEPRHVD